MHKQTTFVITAAILLTAIASAALVASKSEITHYEQEKLQDMFKESLTFD
jgi:hypothetical protein